MIESPGQDTGKLYRGRKVRKPRSEMVKTNVFICLGDNVVKSVLVGPGQDLDHDQATIRQD